MPLKPYLNFNVLDTYDARLLRVEDSSEWAHLLNPEEVSYIDITPPASKTPVTNYFEKGAINKFNSNLLNLTCEGCPEDLAKLPDGIYKIKIYACDGTQFCYEAHYLRTVRTLLELDAAFIGIGLHIECVDKKLLEKYTEIEGLLHSAHILVRKGLINEGSLAFEKAKDLLEDFQDCLSIY